MKKYKVEPKKKTRNTKLATELSNFNSLTEKEINLLFEEECQMANQDRITHETYERKNELESYIYDMRNYLGDKYQAFVQPQHKTSLLQELEKTESWLYSEGAKTTKSIYAQKLEELKKLGDPITNRFKEHEAIPHAMTEFHQNLGTYESIATSTDANFEHITPEERKTVMDAVTEHRNWLTQSGDAFTKANRTEKFPFSSQDVLNKHRAFVEKHYGTINKPKPKPAPQPTKTETPANQEAPKGSESTQSDADQTEKKEMEVEK